MNPLISVIVPVYNVEKYIRQCIDSILSQTYTNFELILVDDGSKDKSGEICDEYAKKDSRIRVFHKTNGGVSSARNLALGKARGEWIAFVDSDDFVDKDYLTIVDVPKGTDVVIKSFKIIKEDGTLISEAKILNNTVQNDMEKYYYQYVNHRQNSLWHRLISKRLIGNNRFNETVDIGEDFLFYLKCMTENIRQVFFYSKGCYTYIYHKDSAMHKVNRNDNKRLKVLFDNVNNVKMITKETRLELLGINIIARTYINGILRYTRILTQERKQQLKGIVNSLKLSDMKYLSTIQKLRLLLEKAYIKIL
ncbi:MAG: glycosyltransferase family 2 protein [Prevotella sp.]|jgi:glycosyltransferase involved in cell wall biosynthesis|nr:glycosyltransferase family 2 protein [Prevotella sp.]MCI2088604.1 glycosyltransferase family 2 protein [Prevotella sp.]MCI2125837.1 glycosyltransferase family 2 protein [Prevotella sp.]